ncbi:MAG TPA: hypothetical protein PLE54_20115 [Burkholderiaceae bacterium]|nr:hypothetical protein [Burkholderiaceae bacterium]
MTTGAVRPVELLAFGVAEAAALLLLAGLAGKVATLLCAALLPLAAWLYARRRAREHTWAIVGAALGLTAFPLSYGLSALMFLPFPFQLLGVPGFLALMFHGFPGNLLATFASLESQADVSLASLLVDYLLNGIVWAAIYGLIGSHFDRCRKKPHLESP